MIRYIYHLCGLCNFFKYEGTKSYGVCSLCSRQMQCSDRCGFLTLDFNMNRKQTVRVLHHYMKWRRGNHTRMLHSRLLELAIAHAITELRAIDRQERASTKTGERS